MSITSLDLNLLLVLHTVLAEQHVARAAAKLHVTPSAISNALARLRVELGDPLVIREGRGIVPTPRARELAPLLARAVREIELVVENKPFDALTCDRMFTLAIADVGQTAWVPAIAADLARSMPRAQLRIINIDALISLGDLGSPEVDLHVGLAAKGVHTERLVEEANVLVARKPRPLAKLRYIRVEMVPGKGDAFAAPFERAGIARDIAVTVPSYATAAAIARTTDLATMLPASLVTKDLKKIPLPFDHVTKLAMNWHDRTHFDAASRSFRTLVARRIRGEV